MQDIVNMFPFIIIFGLVLYMMYSNSRKEKKKKEELLSALKKDSRVQTIGGICGTVVEVRDNEVLLNVDPANNTRITFTKSAIASVVQ